MRLDTEDGLYDLYDSTGTYRLTTETGSGDTITASFTESVGLTMNFTETVNLSMTITENTPLTIQFWEN